MEMDYNIVMHLESQVLDEEDYLWVYKKPAPSFDDFPYSYSQRGFECRDAFIYSYTRNLKKCLALKEILPNGNEICIKSAIKLNDYHPNDNMLVWDSNFIKEIPGDRGNNITYLTFNPLRIPTHTLSLILFCAKYDLDYGNEHNGEEEIIRNTMTERALKYAFDCNIQDQIFTAYALYLYMQDSTLFFLDYPSNIVEEYGVADHFWINLSSYMSDNFIKFVEKYDIDLNHAYTYNTYFRNFDQAVKYYKENR